MKYVLLTTPRTGSTWYCKQISDCYRIPNYNELLSAQIMYGANIPISQRWLHSPPRMVADSVRKFIQLSTEPDWVLKLMPHMWLQPGNGRLLSSICNQADQIAVLVRADLTSQLRSIILGFWLKDQHSSVSWHTEFTESVFIPDNLVFRNLASELHEWLHQELTQLSVLASKYHADVVTLEQHYSEQIRYHRPVVFENPPVYDGTLDLYFKNLQI